MGLLKWLVRDLICMALYYSGVAWLLSAARLRRRGGRYTVLAYHGVAETPRYLEMFCEPRLFRAQMTYVARHYRPAGLEDLLSALTRKTPERLANDHIVVTFDDGYRDNLTRAWPVTRSLGIPMHVFVTTGCIETGEQTFILELMEVIASAQALAVELPEYQMARMPLRTEAERDRAVRIIDRIAKPLLQAERNSLLATLRRKLEVSKTTASGAMLTWSDLRDMAREGVIIGAHSRTHPVLSCLADEQLRDEVEGSRHDLQSRLGTSPRFFAYPYGGVAEVSRSVVAVVRDAGFEGALLLADTPERYWDPHTIGRKTLTRDRVSHPWGGFSPAMFACEIEGIADVVFRRKPPRFPWAQGRGPVWTS